MFGKLSATREREIMHEVVQAYVEPFPELQPYVDFDLGTGESRLIIPSLRTGWKYWLNGRQWVFSNFSFPPTDLEDGPILATGVFGNDMPNLIRHTTQVLVASYRATLNHAAENPPYRQTHADSISHAQLGLSRLIIPGT